MQVAIIFLIAAVIGGFFGSVFTLNTKKQTTIFPTSSPVLKQNISPDKEKSSVKSAETVISPTVTPLNTIIPSPTVVIQQKTNSSTLLGNINDFIYPGSSFSRKDGQADVYTSSDQVNSISNWYKEKINNLHMNTQSMVQTNTNGNVLNSFSAANSELKVDISISKQSSSQVVEIKILLNSSLTS